MSKLVKYYGVNFKQGDYIFREGDAADVMYMIHRGRVQISKGLGSFDENIRILGEGEFVGEMAIINVKPRSASAVAMEDCILIKMDRESFNETIKKNHEFSVSVIQFLSERLRETDELLMKYANQERIGRLLAEILLEMLGSGKRDASGNWSLLNMESFQKDAARHLDWSRDYIRTVLAELIDTNRVTIKKDRSGAEWIAVRAGGEG
ncbi:MAG TPA: Crp/Fnr family transcriptional regulator [Spirochaetota bacterium]|nr:Crp/Fnr family transcriptional regulator [Spirochaetota bacterium]HPG51726.1 Crp/Fnr family transcriptional regulator [Spirochaetota bacterium]HPN13758.1 Crp/Fnr family transcriptional regulator [Spirochaetota bacterium]